MEKDFTKYNGMIVKLTEITWDQKEITVIASFNQDDNGYELGHPYNIADKFMFCGKSYNPNISCIKEISPITKEEYRIWKKEYNDFHLDTMAYKGYDSCEENINLLIPLY